ncbi:hypothetical protein KKC13_05835 [bacterium]|nr:hypothetical protein [bacterium]MBU1957872.1 hypothetical protein [bacterium]
MKKIIYIFLILPVLAMSGFDMVKVNNALLSIKSSSSLKYYSSNKNINITKKLNFTSLEEANIVIFPEKNDNKKMLIVGSYQELRMNKNSIGAVYLKKGRTQIIFVDERLKNNGLSLPVVFQKYVITECQLNLVCLLTLL